MLNPVLKYRGGKSREISYFEKYIPKKYDRYIEPFLGGAALFFYLEPEKAVLNDLNTRLVNFYNQLKSFYPEMRKQLDELQSEYEKNQTKYKALKSDNPLENISNDNEKLYYKMRSLFNNPCEEFLEGVIYFFINKTAYSGMIRYNSSEQYNVPFGRYPNLNTKLVTEEHSKLLQRAEIYNLDYTEIFKMAAPNDFMFLDPPYDCIFNDYGNTDTMNGFDEEQQRHLAYHFKQLNCRALMVIGKTELTKELYEEYIVNEYHKNYSVNIRNRFKNDKIHMIVANYDTG